MKIDGHSHCGKITFETEVDPTAFTICHCTDCQTISLILWAAVDVGLAVQPKNIVAQIEGAMTFGLGAALVEQITVKDGVVQETNFHQYRVMRMSDVPPMDVKVVSSDNKPTGIGEAGVPVVAPAIANAVALLTGKRLRHLPMTPDRVKRGLA